MDMAEMIALHENPTSKVAEGAALEMFIPIVKADEETRQVWGVASSEQFDRDGEIFDYETSKPLIQSWSDTQKSASDGKSLGNVREQHSRISAGRLIALNMNDSTKMVGVGAEVVDESTWQKVLKGVLTGFSWGGKYAKVWKDSGGKAMRYTLAPAELSLVDRPAIPGATFQLVKADGRSEMRGFMCWPEGGKRDMQNVDRLFKTTMQATDRARAAFVLNKSAGSSRADLELRLSKAELLIDQAEASKSASPQEIREARIIVALRRALSHPVEV